MGKFAHKGLTAQGISAILMPLVIALVIIVCATKILFKALSIWNPADYNDNGLYMSKSYDYLELENNDDWHKDCA